MRRRGRGHIEILPRERLWIIRVLPGAGTTTGTRPLGRSGWAAVHGGCVAGVIQGSHRLGPSRFPAATDDAAEDGE